MDIRTRIVAALALAAVLLMALPLLNAIWLKLARRRLAATPDSPAAFGSDDLPPARTIAFNQQILTACGRSLTPEQKLKMLTTEGVTKAQALEFARTTLEDTLSPPGKTP